MKLRVMLITTVCLWAAVATGQIDPNPDGIGIYADLGGLVNEVELEAGVPMEVYLLLTNPSGGGNLGGWECDLIVPDNVLIWGWNITTPGALSMATPPSFLSGFPEIPYQGTVHLLMTFIIVPQDSESGQFRIVACSHDVAGDEPRYLDIDMEATHPDTHKLINLTPYPGGVEGVAFTVNPAPTPTTTALWGDVKALYR